MERIDSNGHLPYISIPHTNTDNCFAETLPSTKQVREGTNHSLTAEKPKVNNHRQRINYMMKKHWHCQK